MPPFAVTQTQIEAAKRLHTRLQNWQLTDQLLAEVRQSYPSNDDLQSVLLKAALLDRLYATNVFAITTAASHIVQTFKAIPPKPDKILLVSQLARVSINGRIRNHVSFASKYAHFFYDDSLPIMDSYAAFTLTIHLDEPKSRAFRWAADYSTYYQKISELLALSKIQSTSRELDHYLWLAGLWLHYKDGKGEINVEARDLFAKQHADLQVAFGNFDRDSIL